jgi:hypothetical protein
MTSTIVPGYRELFGKQPEPYEQLVAGMSSNTVIRLCIVLNNELNAPEDRQVIQKRLASIVSHRFKPEQRGALQAHNEAFRLSTNNVYKNMVFGRRYLIAFLLKELNHFREDVIENNSGEEEYKFLKAYMVVIDEVNRHDHELFDAVKAEPTEPMTKYKLLWTANINQFEFSEHPNTPFETFKLMTFLVHAAENYREYLRRYLNELGFNTVGQLMGSLNSIAVTVSRYHPKEIFKMYNYISPGPGVNEKHLQQMLITQKLNSTEAISLFHIRKFPLFQIPGKGYLGIDADLFKKKTYLGPFFELRTETALKRMNFKQYSGDISLNVIEVKCLQTILRLMYSGNKRHFLSFDDGTDGMPDAYYRQENKVFLFECKAGLFPFELSSEPDFSKIKEYIDTRLAVISDSKAKGVGQLLNQIKELIANGFKFDSDFEKTSGSQKITIYPVIVHIDFFFGLPGINDYLNELLLTNLTDEMKDRFDVRPLTVINMEVLFELAIRYNNFGNLEELILRYQRLIASRKSKLPQLLNQHSYWNAHMSFDEMYHSLFVKETRKDPTRHRSLSKVVASIGITQEVLDEDV